jgi:polyhydroxybutyrate depolymerase
VSASANRSLRLSAFAALLVAACVATGCGGAHAASDQGRPAHPAASCFRASGHQEIAGELVDIPRRLPRRPPLLLVFHGLRESASYLAGETGFDDLAARQRFVVAYPNAVRAQRWQLNHRDGDADIAHIRSFIAAVVRRVCADPRRIYLTGFSNGAGFAARAGCELSGQVAAIAPVSGSYRTLDPCSAGPMPTLELHGRDPWTDTVPLLMAETRMRNHCAHATTRTRMARGITRTRWPGCNLERIYNARIGHEWPKLGPYNTGVEVWNFVRRFSTRGSWERPCTDPSCP